MNKIGIIQPGYIPWLGFFEQMFRCDIFVFLDDVQYTKLDWRNRNSIKTPNGNFLLTVPVFSKGKEGQKINEARIDNTKKWQLQHLRSIEFSYAKTKYFGTYFDELKHFYKKKNTFISSFNVDIILWINEKLGLNRKIVFSSALDIAQTDKQGRLIEICKKLDCNYFYDGKAAEDFINTDNFSNNGIVVEFQDYNHPYYNQLWLKGHGFISHLSIIDLLFNHGLDSLDILTNKKIIQRPESMNIEHTDNI